MSNIHNELYAVYSPNIMSEDVMNQWFRFFKEERAYTNDEPASGRPFVASDNLVKILMAKFSRSNTSQ